MKYAVTGLRMAALWLVLGIFASGFSATPGFTQTEPKVVRIGVLAFRGTSAAQLRWLPLVDYLSKTIEGWQFEFVAVTLASTPRQIETRHIDFLITNPGHYVELQDKYGLSTLATRERRTERTGSGNLEFGTAIITRSDSDIRSLGDIKDKTIAAVSPDAFGGFQLAWHEFQRQNIDPFKDLKSIQFMGFPQDAIITAVETSLVEVGIVRSGLLELLAGEGKIDIASFRVIQSNKQIDYPHMVSGQLYPEWPFAVLSATDKRLRENVLVALLASQNPQIAEKYKLRDLWSTPLSYSEVRHVVEAYNARNSSLDGSNQGNGLIWITAVLIALLALATLTAYLQITRRRQRASSQFTNTTSNTTSDEGDSEMLSRFTSLTTREREILRLICNGNSSKVIAEELGISAKTVEYHRANLLQKTQAGTTPQLVQLATRLGYDNAG